MDIGRLIKTLNTSLERAMNRQMAKFDLTAAQAVILCFLKDNLDKEVCQKDLEQEFGLFHPTMSSILKRMQGKGLIETLRLSQDKRYKHIFLTEKGKALHQEIIASFEQMETKICIGLSAEQQAEFAYLIEVVKLNISR